LTLAVLRQVSTGLVFAVLIVLALPACGRGSDARQERAERVARVGDQAVTEQEFALYLRREIGLGEVELDESARGRLYEEFLAELLLARAAVREGLAPDPDELSREIARLLEVLTDVPAETIDAHARRALLADQYERTILAPAAAISQDEIERELGPPAKRGRREFVVFRQIRTETREAAAEAHRRVTRTADSFEAVAGESSVAPDKGAIQQRELSMLPEPVAGVLAKLPEGSTSRPLEFDGAWYLFRLLARNRDPDPGRLREREMVRDRLFRVRLAELRTSRLEQLATAEGIRPPRLGEATEENSR
jgi:parvulin-like peptidyl-prolyl isomerase